MVTFIMTVKNNCDYNNLFLNSGEFQKTAIIFTIKGAGGVFMVVSDRGDRYLSDAFGPMKNIVPSRSFNRLPVGGQCYSVIVLCARFSTVCPENRPEKSPPTVFEDSS